MISPENADRLVRMGYIETGQYAASIAFSPDGSQLASGGNGVVTLRDIPDGRVLKTLKAGYPGVGSVAFSPDGRYIAAASGGVTDGDTHARVWDAATGELRLQLLEDYEHAITVVAFSPDSTMLAVGGGCFFDVPGSASITLWDVASGKLLIDIVPPTLVKDLAFSPDGRLLASPTGKGLRFWEVTTGKEYTKMDRLTSWAGGRVAFSPDGAILASGGGGWMDCIGDSENCGPQDQILLWDVKAGKQLALLGSGRGYLSAMAFSPDGRILAQLVSKLELWDVETGELLAEFQSHESPSVAFSPDGTVLAVGDEYGTISLWGAPSE